jgi:aminoglycoside phosphotransferase
MMTALAGSHAASAGFVPEQVVALFARALAALHTIDVAQCPFDMRPAVRLADAEARFAAGHIEDDELDDDLVQGRGVRWLIDHLSAGMSDEPDDLVVTHGDACLENVIIAPDGTRVGLIDVGRAGVAHRAQDLALAVRSVRDRYGARGESLFWATYGAVPPAPAVMTYYELLEELG